MTTLLEYIKSKIRACMKDRLEIMSRHRISSMDEFEKKCRMEVSRNIRAGGYDRH